MRIKNTKHFIASMDWLRQWIARCKCWGNAPVEFFYKRTAIMDRWSVIWNLGRVNVFCKMLSSSCKKGTKVDWWKDFNKSSSAQRKRFCSSTGAVITLIQKWREIRCVGTVDIQSDDRFGACLMNSNIKKIYRNVEPLVSRQLIGVILGLELSSPSTAEVILAAGLGAVKGSSQGNGLSVQPVHLI